MTLQPDRPIPERPLGKLLFIGVKGPSIDPETRSILEDVQPGGVCLFARNIQDAGQVRTLTDELRSIVSDDLIVSLDQEGGRVDRLRRVLEPMPSAAQLRSPADAAELAGITALALRMLGFNMDFAPVVDVEGPGRDCSGNGLATRTFGKSREDVAEMASAYAETLETGGVRSCLKHFPGLGASLVDSHEHLPEVGSSREEIEEVDWFPYRAILGRGRVGAVMVAHALYPSLTTRPAAGLPSSLDPGIVNGLLRNSLGFGGLIVTDDLEMGAVMEHHGIGEAAVMAIAAGCDQALICNEYENIRRGFGALTEASEKGSLSEGAVDKAIRRVYAFSESLSEPLEFRPETLEEIKERIRRLKERLS